LSYNWISAGWKGKTHIQNRLLSLTQSRSATLSWMSSSHGSSKRYLLHRAGCGVGLQRPTKARRTARSNSYRRSRALDVIYKVGTEHLVLLLSHSILLIELLDRPIGFSV